jgi:hypothetical protein
MAKFPVAQALLGFGLALSYCCVALAQSGTSTAQLRLPPPMSYPTAAHFAKNPSSYSRFLAQLAKGAATEDAPSGARFATATGGTWQAVQKAPAGLGNPLLLTDGTVMVAAPDSPDWYRLTPDAHGDYANGRWTQLASLPVINGVQYAPLYHASAVLPDGRVIIIGGEYNGPKAEWTNLGAIYDPRADQWTPVQAPIASAWQMIGDAQSTVLADGTFMLASCCAIHPPADILFNPKTLGWKTTGAPRAGNGYQDEQGYELLPNDDVLTVDIWSNFNFKTQTGTQATNAERYMPGSGMWMRAGNTPVALPDPIPCGNFEIGPAVLRGDGTVVAFGGNTGCVTGATNDPTAIYDSRANSWSAGAVVPAVCGSNGSTSCDLADAPAALMPDGNILFAASAGYGSSPTHFFEYSASNTISQVSDTLFYASESGAYYYNFLVLPSGQILETDFSKKAEIYTPSGTPVASWAPVIEKAPGEIHPDNIYTLVGRQLNGVSQGAYYGDDVQAATNYPIVRLTNVASGTVFYARSWNFSSMTVAPHALGSADFFVGTAAPTGPATLVVVANGIASAPVLVNVK